MKLERIWAALTQGERIILAASAVLLGLALIGGAVLLGTAPFESAQRLPSGGTVVDTDGDSLSDDNEALLFGTDPQAEDTDGDGIPDGWEAVNARTQPTTGLLSPDPVRPDAEDDPDGDGLPHIAEYLSPVLTGDDALQVLQETSPSDVQDACGDDRICYATTLPPEDLAALVEDGLGPDATTDPHAPDTDGDGLSDGWEIRSGHDPLDPTTAQLDKDGDGLTAAEEHEQGTFDNAVDSDRDGLTDVEESQGSATIGGETVTFQPTDPATRSTGGSGLADGFAVAFGLDPHAPNVGRQDPDEDGLNTAQEARISLDRFADARTALVEGLDPLSRDTDRDGLPDGWEVTHGLDPLDRTDGDGDTDGDGLSNGEEFFWNTDPLSEDTDGDTLPDGDEVNGVEIELNNRTLRATSNPQLADSDGDGLTDAEERSGSATVDGQEVTFPPTHPLLPDSDGDGIQDLEEIGVVFADRRLDPTLADTDSDGLDDGEELDYWNQREQEAQGAFPEALAPPTSGECSAQATSDIEAQLPSVLGPGGDPDGDCIPNILDPDSDRLEDPELPPGTSPLLDGQEVDPATVQERQLPASDPAIRDTDGDDLPDEWEIENAVYGEDVDGVPTWLFDPANEDSDGDGTPDGEDDDEGQAPGTQPCWEDVPHKDNFQADTPGDSVPWLARSFTNVDEMRQGTDPLSCDTDEDDLVDGWEVAHQAPGIDPLTAPSSWWTGATAATVCYPDHQELDSINALNLERLSGIATVPAAGPVTTPPDPAFEPEGEPINDKLAWALSETGCSWTGTGAREGTDCTGCTVVGLVSTLRIQMLYQTNPDVADTDGDGAPDRWEILWNNLASGDVDEDKVRPHADDSDGDNDRAEIDEEHEEGASPLVADTDEDGEDDGPDPNPLVPGGAGVVKIQDDDGDHLLDGCPESTHEEDDPQRLSALRESLQIVEVESGLFLCEPPADPDGRSLNADGDAIPDVWEMLYTYKETGSASVATLQGGASNNDGDAIVDEAEYRLGRPADWSRPIWWFGSNPFQDSSYDADGDGLAEGLLIDPSPFENLPESPTAGNAWDLACQVGIVCPDGSGFSWGTGDPTSDFEVTIEEVGVARGGNREVNKSQEHLPIEVTVTRSGSPAADTAVAVMALGPNEASQLADGDRSQLARPERVLCILTTNETGVAESPPCTIESTTASADLTGTARTWLGSSTPSWTRNLSVLDPAESNEVQPDPENQPRIVAWAMGTDTDPGASAAQPVVSSTLANITVTNLPETAGSGEEITVRAQVLDGAGDAMSAGELTLAFANQTITREVQGPTVSFSGIQMPDVDEATVQTLDFSYSLVPADFVPSASTDASLRVLPQPDIQVRTPGTAIAGETLPVQIQVTAPSGGPVNGPVQVSLRGQTVNGTALGNGTANLELSVPTTINPGTADLTARFLGSEAFSEATATQQVAVRQRLQATVQPSDVLLGDEVRFTVTVTDLADRPPTVATNVTLKVGAATATATLDPGEELATIPTTVSTPIGQAEATLTTTSESRYEPLQQTVPLDVRTEAITQIHPSKVPRGEAVNLTVNVTDALDRPVPEGYIDASWPDGQANVSVEDGVATLPFSTSPDTEPAPITLSYELGGPGVIASARTAELGIRVGTNLTGALEIDALSGVVTIDLSLRDDQGDPVPGAPLEVNWPLGSAVDVQTDSEGRAQATLVIPEDAQPRDVPVQASFAGDDVLLGDEIFLTAPIRAATTFDVPDEIVWAETKDLVLSGRVVAPGPGQGVSLPVRVLSGNEELGGTSGGVPFTVSIPPGDVTDAVQSADRFTLTLTTPGDDTYAPTEATVVVERLTPVELTTSVDRRGDRIVFSVIASTPQGPLGDATINIGREDGAPVTVTTDAEGRASITLQDATGTLVARYPGDDTRAPSEARVDLASQEAAATPRDVAFYAIATLVVVLLVADAVILYRVYRMLDLSRQVDELLEEMEEGLVAGDEIRAVIYQGYLRLRAIGEVMGEHEEEWETAREFGDKLSDRLDIPQGPVRRLIAAFEEARYADTVDATLRVSVVESLRDIREDMRERGLVG